MNLANAWNPETKSYIASCDLQIDPSAPIEMPEPRDPYKRMEADERTYEERILAQLAVRPMTSMECAHLLRMEYSSATGFFAKLKKQGKIKQEGMTANKAYFYELA